MPIVELDEKGRALLPAALRKKFRTRRFEARAVGGLIELVPLEDMKAVRGKYRGRVRKSWSALEELGEKLVRQGKR